VGDPEILDLGRIAAAPLGSVVADPEGRGRVLLRSTEGLQGQDDPVLALLLPLTRPRCAESCGRLSAC
jgi:hypothetical protein